MRKIMFLAADPQHSGFVCVQHEYTAAHGGMNKAQIQLDHDLAKGHDALVVWYDGAPDPFLSSTIDGQIYLRGHGMPGFVSIELARGAERISYVELVERLIRSGLRREFRGAIKCYNCHSAEPPDRTSPDTEQGNVPFAQMVADELYRRGYKLCKFYGYNGSIDSNVKDGSSGRHKYVRVKDKGKQIEAGRVSDSRVEFFPRIGKSHSPFKWLVKKFL